MKSLMMLVAVLPTAAFAHDGHGTSSGSSLIHYLAEPAHLIPLLTVVAIGWLLAKRRAKR